MAIQVGSAKEKKSESLIQDVLADKKKIQSIKRRLKGACKKRALCTNEIYAKVRSELGIGHLRYGSFGNSAKFSVHTGLKAKLVRMLDGDGIVLSKLFRTSTMSIYSLINDKTATTSIAVYEYFDEKSISLPALRKTIADLYDLKVVPGGLRLVNEDKYSTMWNVFVRKLKLTEEQLLKIFGNKQATLVQVLLSYKP